MFSFFSDVKNRLVALEAHIEAIYAHLREDKSPNAVGDAETATVPPVTSETVVTESTENGSAN